MHYQTCSWCHTENPVHERRCRSCGHDAQRSRLDCTCERCREPLPPTAAGPAPVRPGVVETIDLGTGQVLRREEEACILVPAPPGTCPECAAIHDPRNCHDPGSLFYQMRFHARHGRWPTWSDAMAHCTPEVQAQWRRKLLARMRDYGLEVPADLQG